MKKYFLKKCIVKGANEKENIGDAQMQAITQDIIDSLGFKRLYLFGHNYKNLKKIKFKNRVKAIFTLGSVQFTTAWKSPLQERLEKAIVFKNYFKNAKNVYLPSTWGPFSPDSEDLLKELIDRSLVFARDTKSTKHINETLGEEKAFYCPDLAFLYSKESKKSGRSILFDIGLDPEKRIMGIIPNVRCVEKNASPLSDPEVYYNYLEQVIKWAKKENFQILGLSHMVNTDRDISLLRRFEIPVFHSERIELTRSILANLTMAVCSRYHGLVNCLIHGIPVVAIGWQHKYLNLMADFNLTEYNHSLLNPTDNLLEKLDKMNERKSDIKLQIQGIYENSKKRIHHSIGLIKSFFNMKIETGEK